VWSDNVDDLLADEQNPGLSSRNTLWALSDHLGSIRDIADTNESTGATSIANHRRYDSFGRRVWETNDAVDLVFGYTGKLFDETTRLQNNLNRWYDSSTGRWISQDPIGFAAGDANLYRYVGNRPTNATDPSGGQS
jgi:RHS repeat-associated protein